MSWRNWRPGPAKSPCDLVYRLTCVCVCEASCPGRQRVAWSPMGTLASCVWTWLCMTGSYRILLWPSTYYVCGNICHLKKNNYTVFNLRFCDYDIKVQRWQPNLILLLYHGPCTSSPSHYYVIMFHHIITSLYNQLNYQWKRTWL